MNELAHLLAQHGLSLVFGFTLAARLGSPIPAAPLLLVAGSFAAGGEISVIGCVVLAVAANLAGDVAWFLAGRRWGSRILTVLCRVSLTPDSCARQSESMIGRWGGYALIAAKFVPGVSVVAAPMAGALAMSWPRFLAYGVVSGAIWTAVFMGLGALFDTQIDWLLEQIARGGMFAIAALAIGVAAALALRYVQRQRVLRELAVPRISVNELRALMASGAPPVVIDVRSAPALQADQRRIPGAIWSDLHAIADLAEHLPRHREIVLYCTCPNEVSAARGARILIDSGVRRARPLAGGLEAWLSVDGEGDDRPAREAQAVLKQPKAGQPCRACARVA